MSTLHVSDMQITYQWHARNMILSLPALHAFVYTFSIHTVVPWGSAGQGLPGNPHPQAHCRHQWRWSCSVQVWLHGSTRLPGSKPSAVQADGHLCWLRTRVWDRAGVQVRGGTTPVSVWFDCVMSASLIAFVHEFLFLNACLRLGRNYSLQFTGSTPSLVFKWELQPLFLCTTTVCILVLSLLLGKRLADGVFQKLCWCLGQRKLSTPPVTKQTCMKFLCI